jgi:hypothetical protein
MRGVNKIERGSNQRCAARLDRFAEAALRKTSALAIYFLRVSLACLAVDRPPPRRNFGSTQPVASWEHQAAERVAFLFGALL